MDKRNIALEYYDYLVKTNPDKSVSLKFYIRVYDGTSVEASSQPFILDKPCDFVLAEYVLMSGSGFKTKIENIQLYFNNEGESFEYAPYKDGKLKIDMRQAWAGYEGSGYYDCSYIRDGITFSYNGCPSIDFLSFCNLYLSYVDLVASCSTQKEVDYLKECFEKDINIDKIKKDNLLQALKISRLEDEIAAHKDFIEYIKSLLPPKE